MERKERRSDRANKFLLHEASGADSRLHACIASANRKRNLFFIIIMILKSGTPNMYGGNFIGEEKIKNK